MFGVCATFLCHLTDMVLWLGTINTELSKVPCVSLFLKYAAQYSCSDTAHTVHSHSLLDRHYCGCSRLCVTCQNNYGCTNQQPVLSWQCTGSHVRVSAARSCLQHSGSPFKPGVCQDIALQALPGTRKSAFSISADPVHSASFWSPILSRNKALHGMNSEPDFCL